MPRPARRAAGRRGWSWAQRQQLTTGYDYFGAWGDGVKRPYAADPAEVEREIRQAWTELAAELTAAAIAAGHGTRPWGWWCFESPQPRQRDLPEALQLSRMMQLQPNEQHALEAAKQQLADWLAFCKLEGIPPRGRWGILPLPVEHSRQRARAERERSK